MNIHGGFLHGVVHRKFCDEQMAAEVVDPVFNCFLKSFHNQKGNNGGTQPNANTYDCDFMNGCRKPIARFQANSSRYKIRQVQFSITFECIGQDNR